LQAGREMMILGKENLKRAPVLNSDLTKHISHFRMRHRAESAECAFAVINKPESQLTIRQMIELELFCKLKIMVTISFNAKN